MMMQWPPHVDLLPTLRTPLQHLQVSRDSPPLLIIHEARLAVTHPGVGATSARVDPHDVLEAKVLAQGGVGDLDGHGYELPALEADVGLVAAGTDVVVVGQIDIEAQLFGQGLKAFEVPELFSVARVGTVDGANIETGWDVVKDIFPHAVEA